MQEELWRLIPAAIGALRHELEANKNLELAYQIIRDIGMFSPPREFSNRLRHTIRTSG